MNYENAVKTLCSQGKFYIDLGLERTKKALEILGNPQEKINAIQVAGTNGKGSVCSILESILREAGYKTGLYTSPHIFEYTERIKINGEDISQDEFGKYFELVNEIAEKNNIPLTEFEILTIMMFKYFADNNVEIAIIETGLGGRLDATNVLEQNICAVITHIDYDHTERLGNTKDAIATEKAGIIKPDSTIITSEGYEVVKDKADEVGALFVLANPCVEPVFAEALELLFLDLGLCQGDDDLIPRLCSELNLINVGDHAVKGCLDLIEIFKSFLCADLAADKITVCQLLLRK